MQSTKFGLIINLKTAKRCMSQLLAERRFTALQQEVGNGG
jgi:hypothetical protein